MENKFKKINDTFDRLSEKYKKEVENVLIRPIHPDFLFAQNGICAFIAGMGKGKTYNYLKMVSQSEVLFDQPFFESVVISSTSGKFDKTVEIFQQAIRKTELIHVKDDDLLEFLNDHLNKVLTYNSIMAYVNNGLKEPNAEMIKLLKENGLLNRRGEFDYLKLINFVSNKLTEIGWKTYPHRMLLILDDFSSHPLLKRKETELSRFLKKLRHFFINVMICVQTTKSIPKDIKRNLSDCILFPGINYEDFTYLMKESSLGSLGTPNDLWDQYSKIKDPRTMIKYHVSANKVVIRNY